MIENLKQFDYWVNKEKNFILYFLCLVLVKIEICEMYKVIFLYILKEIKKQEMSFVFRYGFNF